MRPTTAPETILRTVCRRLGEEGARMSVFAASEANGIAVGSWPGVCDEIGLVLVGDEGRIQVQAGEDISYVDASGADPALGVMAILRRPRPQAVSKDD